MRTKTKVHADRLGAFSDAVIAVIITIMVLELKAPASTTFSGLLPLWPTAVAYAVSFLFIAIIWTNHHHLLRLVQNTTNRLIWVNFAHLFMVSLVPFATAWIAEAHVAPAPVVAYAAIFFCVNLVYRIFEKEVFAQASDEEISRRARLIARRRSLGALAFFAAAALVGFVLPLAGLVLIVCPLAMYMRPDIPDDLDDATT
ncbi:MAG: TMEM175 family protein [Luteibacter jiangsuensis]